MKCLGCHKEIPNDSTYTYCWGCLDKIVEKHKKDKEERIHSMEEFQKKYFPDFVGKECPYCGADIDRD